MNKMNYTVLKQKCLHETVVRYSKKQMINFKKIFKILLKIKQKHVILSIEYILRLNLKCNFICIILQILFKIHLNFLFIFSADFRLSLKVQAKIHKNLENP